MARRRKQKRENVVEKEYKTKIKYHCPKRGWVEQEVTVTRYQAQDQEENKYGYSFMENEEETTEE
jgi:succinate dehydrogenase flavin-adding protein (antitoxin of CptAB toxin-antitoxin module)